MIPLNDKIVKSHRYTQMKADANEFINPLCMKQEFHIKCCCYLNCYLNISAPIYRGGKIPTFYETVMNGFAVEIFRDWPRGEAVRALNPSA
jgi:hypothetical protein